MGRLSILLLFLHTEIVLDVNNFSCIYSEISIRFNSASDRSGEDLRNKFKKLKGHRKPTGTANIPPEILRAKTIQRDIEKKMGVEELTSERDEEDDEEVDFEDDDDLDDDDETFEVSIETHVPTGGNPTERGQRRKRTHSP